MEELNFIGGGFDDFRCEQGYDELAVGSVRLEHLAACLTPWERPDLCFNCFAPSLANEVLRSSTEVYRGQQHTAATPTKTYAQAAAWSPEYDAAWDPQIEPMPTRHPRTVSVAEAARLVTHSRHRQYTARSQQQRQIMNVDDVFAHAEDATATSRRQIMTYAEVVQQPDPQHDSSHDSFDSHSLFTSTENSSGLPNQIIYGAPQNPPHRTSRTPTLLVSPYPIAQSSHLSPQDVCIPTLTQPEYNFDPRDPCTLVQRTGRGGHREPVLSSLDIVGLATPMSCGTLSTASATSRPRRKGIAMKDPTLPHKCLHCGRTYAEKDNLTRHTRRTHSEVQSRPHPCLQRDCPWRFVNPKDLKRHERTHALNSTPAFPCPHQFCVKLFTRRDNLNRHIRAEHTVDSGLGTSRSSSEYADPSSYSHNMD